eukprot:1162080-Pelagomonas_calceolata.AAC.1
MTSAGFGALCLSSSSSLLGLGSTGQRKWPERDAERPNSLQVEGAEGLPSQRCLTAMFDDSPGPVKQGHEALFTCQ